MAKRSNSSSFAGRAWWPEHSGAGPGLPEGGERGLGGGEGGREGGEGVVEGRFRGSCVWALWGFGLLVKESDAAPLGT